MEKVYFTGMGIISSLGIGKEENRQQFYRGTAGISEVDFKDRHVHIARNQSFDVDTYFSPRITRRMEEFSTTLLTASKLAMEDANFNVNDSEQYGSVFSTYWGPLKVTEEFFTQLVENGPLQVQPMLFPCLVTNASLGRVAKYFGLKGVSSYLVGTCSLEYAYNFISRKKVPGILVGAYDEIYENNYAALATHYLLKEDKEIDKLPIFSSGTDGVILGEAATVCLIESENQIIERKSRKLAELKAITSRFCPLLINQIKVDDAIERFTKNMKQTIKNAELKIEDIGCIVSAANGDQTIDFIEQKAFENVFGKRLENIAVVTPKENFGEVISSGSILSCYTAIEILQTKKLPPCTKRYDEHGSFVELKENLNEHESPYILCNSFIPGSNINSIIVGAAD